jgi:hypothetical protein
MNSKNKGNTFERKIAKMLSERFAEHTGIEQAFRRNIDSGSFFGGSNQARTKTHDLEKASFGDIIAPSDFVFNIECKHYKTPPTFVSILKQECGTLDKWIAQAETDSKSSGKRALIIAKFNNVPEMAILGDAGDVPNHSMKYKDYVIVSLEELLKKGDSFFFFT